MSALIQKNLPEELRWYKYRGNFDEIRPFLMQSFTESIAEFKASIEDKYLSEELGNLIHCTCFPFPEKRGHPQNIGGICNQFSMERFVSLLDRLEKRYTYFIGK
jgi:hypothetical protein